MTSLILITILYILFSFAESQNVRQEHSLLGPFTKESLENWYTTGSTETTINYVALTSGQPNQQGAMWNVHKFTRPDWEFQVHFMIHGEESKSPGDGLAIWYVKDPLHLGPVFGSKDYFSGLGVFIDTSKDEVSPHNHPHPYISAMVNNGSSKYHHDIEGTYTELGNCYVDVRNKNHLTRVAVAYIENTLSIFTDAEGTGTWKICFSAKGVHLPTEYYFGVSASTGDRTDSHNIISITGMEYDIPRNVDNFANIIPHAEFHQPPREHVGQHQHNIDQFLAETLLKMQDLEMNKAEEEKKAQKTEEEKNRKAESVKAEKKKAEEEKKAQKMEEEKIRKVESVKAEEKTKKEKTVKQAKTSKAAEEIPHSSSLLTKIIYITGSIIIIVVGISTCMKYLSRRRESMQKRLY